MLNQTGCYYCSITITVGSDQHGPWAANSADSDANSGWDCCLPSQSRMKSVAAAATAAAVDALFIIFGSDSFKFAIYCHFRDLRGLHDYCYYCLSYYYSSKCRSQMLRVHLVERDRLYCWLRLILGDSGDLDYEHSSCYWAGQNQIHLDWRELGCWVHYQTSCIYFRQLIYLLLIE